jgi:DNA-binding protein HU-beta
MSMPRDGAQSLYFRAMTVFLLLDKQNVFLILLSQHIFNKTTIRERGKIMTKAELIDRIASGAGLSKADASRALDSALDSIKAALKKGQKVTLVGFGTFGTSKRKARKGRNPRTGQVINIPAAKTPKFTAGKALKDAIKK